MPIYEYECMKCGKRFEALRPLAGDDAEVRCPSCDGEVERQISTFSGMGAAKSSSCNNGRFT